MLAGHDLSVFQRRPYIERGLEAGFADGIYYSYHNAQPGENSYCYKRGPFPYLWYMDPAGYAGWSQIALDTSLQEEAAQYPVEKATAVVQEYCRRMLTENHSVLPQPETIPEAEIEGLESFVFYSLQVNNDEVMKLTEVAQYESIKAAAAAAKKMKRHLVFKQHPLCKSSVVARLLGELAKSKYVHVSVGSVNKLLSKARSVLVTNSTVGFQALVLGKPVFTVGKSEYSFMTQPIQTPEEIAEVFRVTDFRQPERVLRQIGYLLSEYFVDMRDPQRLGARLQEHAAVFARKNNNTQSRFQAEELDSYKIYLTAAHRLEKETHERLEFLLESYSALTPPEKPAIVAALSNFVSHGHFVEKILRSTDGEVALRSLKLVDKRKDSLKKDQILRALCDIKTSASAKVFYDRSREYYAAGDEFEGLRFARLAASHPKASTNASVFCARKLLSASNYDNPELRLLIQGLAGHSTSNTWLMKLRFGLALHDNELERAAEVLKVASRDAWDKSEAELHRKQLQKRLKPPAPTAKARPVAKPKPAAKPKAAATPSPDAPKKRQKSH